MNQHQFDWYSFDCTVKECIFGKLNKKQRYLFLQMNPSSGYRHKVQVTACHNSCTTTQHPATPYISLCKAHSKPNQLYEEIALRTDSLRKNVSTLNINVFLNAIGCLAYFVLLNFIGIHIYSLVVHIYVNVLIQDNFRMWVILIIEK